MVLPQGGSTFVSGGEYSPLRGDWINPWVRRSGTHCWMNSEIRRVMLTASNSSSKQTSSAFTSATSSLEVNFIFNVVHFTGLRFTYLLIYLFDGQRRWFVCVAQIRGDCTSDEVTFVVQHRSNKEDHLRHLGRVCAAVSTAAARHGQSIHTDTSASPSTRIYGFQETNVGMYINCGRSH